MVEAAPELGVGVAKTERAGGRWPSARDGTGLSIRESQSRREGTQGTGREDSRVRSDEQAKATMGVGGGLLAPPPRPVP